MASHASTGVACRIDKLIEGLSSATDVKTLIPMVQRILREINYYVGSSDGAIVEAQEGWHDEYAAALRGAAGSAAAAANAPPPVRLKDPKKQSKTHHPAAAAKPAHRSAAAPRPQASPLPSTLQAIFDGTHSSFRDNTD